jgi:sigma-B regulation protein RsbU (phosphoserine phosphatase)
MMVSKVIIQSCAMLGKSAGETLTRTNEAICSKNQTEMFVTVWLGILEISTGILTAANAGHEYPVIKRAGGQYELYKDKHGLVIGGIENLNYSEYIVQLKKGDRFFLYTDGVPEAADKDNKMFGVERMLEALNNSLGYNLQDTLASVRRAVSAFVKDAEQFDDLTMLCLEYRGK